MGRSYEKLQWSVSYRNEEHCVTFTVTITHLPLAMRVHQNQNKELILITWVRVMKTSLNYLVMAVISYVIHGQFSLLF